MTLNQASIVFLLSLAGCSSTTATNNVVNSDSGADATEAACQNYAHANCDKRKACTDSAQTEGEQILVLFGDMNTCVEREALMCLDAVRAKDSGFTAAQADKCATAHANWSCSDFLDNIPPAECAPTGGRANGAVCAFNGQCESGFCSGNRNQPCGVCADTPSAGSDCTNSLCGHAQLCVDGTCRARGALLDACDVGTAPCQSGLFCTGPAGGTRTCQTAVAEVAAACGGTSLPGCYYALGLWCTGTGQKTCTIMALHESGQPCGPQADGTQAECKAGNCFTPTGSAAVTDVGTCKDNAGDGEPCDAQLGPTCIPPARCITGDGGTTGTCRVPDAAACG